MKYLLRLSIIISAILSTVIFSQISQAYVLSLTNSGDSTYWYTHCIPFWLSTTGAESLDRNIVERDLIASLRTWDNVECTALSFTYEGEIDSSFIGYDINENADNHNILTFVSPPQPWLYDPSVLALTTVTMCVNDTPDCAVGTIIDADIEINEQGYQFTTSEAQRVQMDLANTITHELGHFLGIDHSNVVEATMYFQQNLGEINKRNLADDDQNALCSIFPMDDDRICTLDAYQFGIMPDETQENSNRTPPANEGCQQTQDFGIILNLFSLVLLIMLFRTRYSDRH